MLQLYRQTDVGGGRQTDRYTDKQIDRQPNRQQQVVVERQKMDTQINELTGKHTNRQVDTSSQTDGRTDRKTVWPITILR